SLGLLCIYLGAWPWSSLRVAALGALANGLAFMAAAVVVAWLLSDTVLAKFYKDLEYARVLILLNSGLIGAAIGSMVLWQFKRSERARQDDAEHAAERARAGIPRLAAVEPPEGLDPVASPRPGIVGPSYGGGSFAKEEDVGGRLRVLQAGLHVGRRHQRLSHGPALGRCRLLPHVRGEGP